MFDTFKDKLLDKLYKRSKVTLDDKIKVFEYETTKSLFDNKINTNISIIDGYKNQDSVEHVSNHITKNVRSFFRNLFSCFHCRSKSNKRKRDDEIQEPVYNRINPIAARPQIRSEETSGPRPIHKEERVVTISDYLPDEFSFQTLNTTHQFNDPFKTRIISPFKTRIVSPFKTRTIQKSPKPIVFNKNGQFNLLKISNSENKKAKLVDPKTINMEQAISVLSSERMITFKRSQELNIADRLNNEKFLNCLRTLVHILDKMDDKELIRVLHRIVNSTDVGGRFKLISKLGCGSSGSVFKAYDFQTTNRARLVAIKKMNLAKSSRKGLYLNEVIIMRELKHSNIVEMYGSYLINKELWVVMEYLEGGELSRFIGRMTEKQIAYVTKCVLKALDFLHTNGIIHRDVKSQQILLSKDGSIKLADYGYVAQHSDLFECKCIVGTTDWMAPEVWSKSMNGYDEKIDIWSLGITVKEMIVGEKFIRMKNVYPANITTQLRSLLMRMLVIDPSKRASAAELLENTFIKQPSSRECLLSLLNK